MSRKTVNVELVLEKANYYLRTTGSHVTPEMRQGVASLLETILHETGNYAGYGSLSKDQVPAGQKPGIRLAPNGELLPHGYNEGERFYDVDDSRRVYYKHRKL